MPTNSSKQNFIAPTAKVRVLSDLKDRARLIQALTSYEDLGDYLGRSRRTRAIRGVGKILFDIVKDEPMLGELLNEYYHRALQDLTSDGTAAKRNAESILSALKNLGIGEVVFVSPEGPQASSGGLGQVICGLMKSFDRDGIPSTLVTVLYEEENGEKHASAERLINEGLRVEGKTIELSPAGELEIPFGPTTYFGTNHVVREAQVLKTAVFTAEHGIKRFVFLRQPELSRRLYGEESSEAQIRSALFLSRGTLEVFREHRLDIVPHLVISNDWMTGLVPAILKTDPLYSTDAAFADLETIHLIHNCGSDYQGRFAASENGIDRWPMFGLGNEHYFGIADPSDPKLINMTAAAIFHVEKAVLTVSRPYADQLLSDPQGAGAAERIREKKNIVYGISNGIDTELLEKTFLSVRDKAQKLFDRPRTGTAIKPLTKKNIRKEKQIAKTVIQNNYRFAADPKAIFISFVGRLTEQKGLKLFEEPLRSNGKSVLATLLEEFSSAQIFIGGPGSIGDPNFEKLRTLIRNLDARFPGRIRAAYEYLAHEQSLLTVRASDVVLMPSRYEPGGIVQLEALAAGTPVVARNVGGIAATLIDYNVDPKRGNAFLFDEYTPDAFYSAIRRALNVISDPEIQMQVIKQAINSRHDWSERVPKYRALFQHIVGATAPSLLIPFLRDQLDVINEIRALPRTGR